MRLFGVSEGKESLLKERMARLGVREEDLQEEFVRSGGPGGQNVNKVSTCVWLRHPASGVEVKCQLERSQALNRFLARRMLCEKLEEKLHGIKSARRQAIEKLRRQKRKRSKRSKEKMLEAKRRHSLKKQLRGKPRHDD